MIYYVATASFSGTIRRFLAEGGPDFRALLRPLTYEELFFERAGPIGHYIFTDFDRLTPYEIETAARFVRMLRQAAPSARILNDPIQALQRLPLLVALHEAGINDFTAIRIENGVRPEGYPVFIRAEDGYAGPETGLLHNAADYDAALADLAARDLPRRGRIAVGYRAEADENGFFRKYGAFSIGGRIVPQHLMRGEGWVVKRASSGQSDADAEEELRFVRENPHSQTLQRAFKLGRLDFGRADYGMIDGRVQVYEINTNPSFPRFTRVDARSERRRLIREAMLEAFRALDSPIGKAGRVHFTDILPRAKGYALPHYRQFHVSLVRRLADLLRGHAKS